MSMNAIGACQGGGHHEPKQAGGLDDFIKRLADDQSAEAQAAKDAYAKLKADQDGGSQALAPGTLFSAAG